jgi:hypothetical protein
VIRLESRRVGSGFSVRRATWSTILPLVVLAVLPTLLHATAIIYWLRNGTLAWDFHHELYPQAKTMLSGQDPYPGSGHDPATGTNLVWPPIAAFVVAPLTLLPPRSADLAIAVAGFPLLAGAVWLVGVRDWRVYGAFALWPPVFMEPGLAHLTPLVALLSAAAWRLRANVTSGILVGLAVSIKFFVWPLGAWLAASRRMGAAFVAVVVVAASLLLLLPYTPLAGYVSDVAGVSRTFDQDSYTIFGLLAQAGLPDVLGRIVTVVVGVALLLATWRYRSFTLAIASALALSPVIWLDYFALAAVPLAIARPRLSLIWFVPLVTAGLEGGGLAIGDTLGTLRVLGAFAIVFAVAFRGEVGGNSESGRQTSAYGLRRAHGRASDTRNRPFVWTSWSAPWGAWATIRPATGVRHETST